MAVPAHALPVRDLADAVKRSGFNEYRNADLMINISDRTIFAHTVILARATPLFQNNFSQMTRGQRRVIEFRDNNPAAVIAVFQAIYGLDWVALANAYNRPPDLQLYVDVYIMADS